MERVRPTNTFPRWPSPLVRAKTGPETGSEANLTAHFTALRRQGWTVWFGKHTRQYWAAHTGLMRLVCADSPEELLHTVTSVTGPPLPRSPWTPLNSAGFR